MATLQPQLAAIVADFERQQRRLHALVDGMPDARWSSRADPTRWSVAECVAHLNLTSEAYLPVLRAALAGAPVANGARPSSTRYRRDPIGWLISVAAGPLPSLGGRRLGGVRAPASFVPGGDLPRAAVMATFDRLQAEQIAITRDADGAPLTTSASSRRSTRGCATTSTPRSTRCRGISTGTSIRPRRRRGRASSGYELARSRERAASGGTVPAMLPCTAWPPMTRTSVTPSTPPAARIACSNSERVT